jgi:gamma-glutamylcyclotransferase (GGCT)/AIG2-like uncharacterized protein YtfP
MNTPLVPVFVYGTLRNGLGNYNRILAGATLHETPATLNQATMRDAGGCPFVSLDRNGGTVTGEVMYLDPATAPATMSRLDRLESYRGPNHPDNMYERILTKVTLADGTVENVFTYVTSRAFTGWVSCLPVIDSGNWHDRAETREPAMHAG